MSVNKHILKGNLGSDVKIHTFPDGTKAGQFTLATNSSYINKENGEKVTTTEWHNCRLRNGLVATFEKYIKKGHEVYIEGPSRTRNYTDNEGVTRYVKEIWVDDFDFCKNPSGSAPVSDGNVSAGVAPQQDGNTNKQQDHDDLPF